MQVELVGKPVVNTVLVAHMAEVAVELVPDSPEVVELVLGNPVVVEHMVLEHIVEVVRTEAEAVVRVFLIALGNWLHSEWDNHLFDFFSF